MTKKIGTAEVLGRRVALRVFAGAGVAVAGAVVMAACGSKGGAEGSAKAGAAGDCTTVPDVDSLNMRRTMQYKVQSDFPDKLCSNCAQYTPNTFGDCGGCKLFTGPVQPKGHCISYAPIGAPAGSGSAAPKASG